MQVNYVFTKDVRRPTVCLPLKTIPISPIFVLFLLLAFFAGKHFSSNSNEKLDSTFDN